MDPRMSFK
jgi:hypothetical protein